jgi:hypothetical protein
MRLLSIFHHHLLLALHLSSLFRPMSLRFHLYLLQ